MALNDLLSTIDDIKQQDVRGQAAGAMNQAYGTNPDQYAEFKRLEKKTGRPAQWMADDPEIADEAKRAMALDGRKFDTMPSHVQSYLSNPENAKISSDDIEGLSGIANVMSKVRKGAGSLAAIPWSASQGLWSAPRVVGDLLQTITKPLAEMTGLPDVGGALADYSTRQQKGAADTAKKLRGGREGLGVVESAVYFGIESLGQNILMLPATIMSGSPVPMLAGMSAIQGGQSYGEARDKGHSIAASSLFGASQASIEYATEMIPALRFVNAMKGKTTLAKALKSVLGPDVLGEQVATLSQDLNDWAVLNPEKPFASYIEERPAAMVQTFIATIIGTGGMVATAKGLEKIGSSIDQHNAVKQQSDFLLSLGDSVKASKTFARLPDNIKTLVRAIKQDGDVQDIFVPVEKVQQLFQSKGMDAAQQMDQILSDPSRYYEAVATGGDVAIPLEDFAALAGDDIYSELMADAKLKVDGISANEQAEFNKPENQEEMLADLLAEANQEATDGVTSAEDEQSSYQKFYDDSYGQLVSIGRNPDQAHAESVTLARTKATLLRAGIPEEQLLSDINVTRGPLPEALQKPKGADTQIYEAQISAMIDKIKTGKVPKGSEMFGPSLMEFLRVKGLQDSGGELAAREIDRGTKFKKKLVREGGMTLDRAREAAAEEGYLPMDSTIDDLLLLIDKESRGDAVYSPNYGNQKLQDESLGLQELQQWLDAMDIDLNTTDNAKLLQLMQASLGGGTALNQKGDDKTLIITHNMTAANILHAIKMGGIAVPSLAITDKDQSLTGFGEVTLIGSKNLADPKGYAKTQVFGSDIYSPRYPDVTLIYTPKAKQKLLSDLSKWIDYTGGKYFDIDQITQANRAVENLKYSTAFQAMFLDSKDIKPEQVSSDENITALEKLKQDGFGKWIGKKDWQELGRDKNFQSAVAKNYSERYKKAGLDRIIEGASLLNMALDTARTIDRLAREGSVQKIDIGETSRAIEKQIKDKGLEDELEQYASDTIAGMDPDEKIFQGFTYSGNKKYTAHTLENVVKILKKDLRGGEGVNYGVGSLRAHFTPQFKSIEQIRKSKDRLLDKEYFDKVKDEIDTEFQKVADQLRVYSSRGKEFGFSDTVISIMEESAKKGISRTLTEYGFEDVPDDVKQEMAGFLNQLRNLPTEYFEAKILRDVDLSEFSGAVVPDNIKLEVRKELEKRGLKITEYEKGNETDRRAKVSELSSQMEAQGNREILFQTHFPAIANTLFQAAYHGSSIGGEISPEFVDLFNSLSSSFGESGPVEGNNKPVALQSHVDSAWLNAKRFADLFKGDIVFSEESSLVGSPAFAAMLSKVRGAILDKPQILNTIIGAVPVDMVNNLFGSKAAAKVFLHDQAMLKDGSAFDTDLPITGSGDTPSPVHLLLSQAASMAAKSITAGVSVESALESEKNSSTLFANRRDGFGHKGAPRAYIRFDKNSILPHFDIALLKDADASSFLHEVGHYYFEMMTRLVESGTAPERMQNDFNGIMKWMGAENVEGLTVRQLEQFADGFLEYLKEGKAPSVELQSVFSRFKTWLKAIYETFRNADVQLTDEVRSIFDRMLATDEEIALAQGRAEAKPMFTTAKDAGMSEAVFAAYKKLAEDAHEAAVNRLDAIKYKETRRSQDQWYKEAHAAMTAEVEAEAKENPVYELLNFIRTGKLFDGSEFEGGSSRLNGAALKRLYDAPTLKAFTNKLGIFYQNEGGVNPEEAATMFGFGSVDEMIRKAVEAPKMKEWVKAETEIRMQKTYPEKNSSEIADDALAAVNNDDLAKVFREELKAINRKRTEVKPYLKAEKQGKQAARKAAFSSIPPLGFFKIAAAKHIASLKVVNLHPYKFAVAEAKAGREALTESGKGNFEKAAAAKQRQILNHYLYREALSAKESADKTYSFMRRMESGKKQSALGLAGQEYLDQMNNLLDQYEFRRVPIYQLEARENLGAWIQRKMESTGAPFPIDPAALKEAETVNYMTLTVGELKDVYDTAKLIDFLADNENKLSKMQDKKDLLALAREIAGSIALNGKKIPRDPEKNRPADISGNMRRDFFAVHAKVSRYAREMDGFEDGGIVWNSIVRQMNIAGDNEADMKHKAAVSLQKIFGVYSVIERTKMYRKEYIPEANINLSKWGRIMVALNMGNEGNRQRLASMYSNEDIAAIVNTLDERDWQFVQNTLDHINSYWNEIEAKEKRIHGIAPPKVESLPIQTPFGILPGGYFPIVYDNVESPLIGDLKDADMIKQMMQGYAGRAVTAHGHTEARQEAVNKDLNFDVNDIFNHVNQVIHDLTHHEALMDVSRIFASDPVNKAMIDYHGPEVRKQFKTWLIDIAQGDAPAKDSTEWFLNYTRTGVSIAGLGWNIITSLIQPLGLTQSMVRIGPQWVGRGLKEWFKNPTEMVDKVNWIYENSKFMRTRGLTINREIAEVRGGLTLGIVPPAVKDSFFWMIQATQKMVDIPTWLGQYEKSMAAHGVEADAIHEADQAVIDSQSGGGIKDLAAIQRGGPLKKLFTTFFSFFSSTWQLAAEAGNKTEFKSVSSVAKLTANMMLLYIIPSVLNTALKEAINISIGGDPDDDEELMKKLSKDIVGYVMNQFVGIREMNSAIQGWQGYEGPAGTRIFSTLAKFYKQVEQGEADAAAWKAANQTAGILLHYPAVQVQRVVDGMIEISENRGNPLSLLFGKPKK